MLLLADGNSGGQCKATTNLHL